MRPPDAAVPDTMLRGTELPGRGPCRDHDPELWWALPGSLEEELAKQICGTCPAAVLAACEQMSKHEPEGIWAGRSHHERPTPPRQHVSRVCQWCMGRYRLPVGSNLSRRYCPAPKTCAEDANRHSKRMSRPVPGSPLSQDERALIFACAAAHMSIAAIAKRVRRSRETVTRALGGIRVEESINA